MTKTLARLLMVCGLGYFTGQGVSADYDMAVSAYHRNDYSTAYRELLPLAKSGDARAQALVAMMYKYGEAVEVDYAEAFTWYLASAKQGYPPAQYSLSELYEAGKGTPADPELAHYWLKKAAAAGLTRATDKLQQHELRRPGESGGKPEAWSRDWNFDLPPTTVPDYAASQPYQSGPDQVATGPATAEPQAILPGYRVQLGAMKTVASANRLWDQVEKSHPDLFEGQPLFLNSSRINGINLVKVQVGAFPTQAEARHFCKQIQASGIKSGCLTVATHPELDLPR